MQDGETPRVKKVSLGKEGEKDEGEEGGGGREGGEGVMCNSLQRRHLIVGIGVGIETFLGLLKRSRIAI